MARKTACHEFVDCKFESIDSFLNAVSQFNIHALHEWPIQKSRLFQRALHSIQGHSSIHAARAVRA